MVEAAFQHMAACCSAGRTWTSEMASPFIRWLMAKIGSEVTGQANPSSRWLMAKPTSEVIGQSKLGAALAEVVVAGETAVAACQCIHLVPSIC